MPDDGRQGGQILPRRTGVKVPACPSRGGQVLRCEGSVAMVAEAGVRAKGEVAGGTALRAAGLPVTHRHATLRDEAKRVNLQRKLC